ncbi:MAG: TIGR03557 family F420-dependent LLM class oxidoreductase [Candidatus Promineifilaceae bacterium]|nr:TIGR03557 family F420-dependent LLM class oxidoreductase [Candidatus Promineifilaceae bacterium]
MPEFGYWLSSEEHGPRDLVRNAQRAEQIGFPFTMISDHYHPWLSEQPEAPFVWTVVGAIAATTETLRLGTGVTCPLLRTHPAIIAHAAATAAAMMPGRFLLGVGTGENLNEHILGDGWPTIEIRQEMLKEAVELIRKLWEGETTTFYGDYYVVEDARLFTVPEDLPPILVAASGTGSGQIAGEIGDGLISVGPNAEVVEAFAEAGGQEKPRYAKLTICYAPTKEAAIERMFPLWRQAGLPGILRPNVRTVAHFDQAVEMVSEQDLADQIAHGPDPETYVEAIRALSDAGFEKIALHQIGANQEQFLEFYQKEIAPRF